MSVRDGSGIPCAAPLVSVIVVVYNGAATLERALESVFSQDRSLVECVVIDGGSTDGTVDLLERFSAQIDDWKSEPDAGIYDAMNKGADRARGRFVYYLGCDDVLLADLGGLSGDLVSQSTIYYGDVLQTKPRRIYDGRFTAWKIVCRNICHQAIFYPADLVRRERFTLRYKFLADWEFNLRCFGDKGVRFQYLPRTIALYSTAGVSATRRDDAFEEDRSALFRRHLPTPVYVYHLLRKYMRRQMRTLGLSR